MTIYLYFRKGGFYPIELMSDQDAINGAIQNPGTIGVVRADTMKSIWSIDAGQAEPSKEPLG